MSKEEAYLEAASHISNGRDNLKKAGKEHNFYLDIKYVKTGCGIAYSGVLFALDYYLANKGVVAPKSPKKKSIEWYRDNIAKIDRKLLNTLNNVYSILHIDGYYEGINGVKVIQVGFDYADDIVKRIKP
jgi:Domain of unknown function (DUF5618)